MYLMLNTSLPWEVGGLPSTRLGALPMRSKPSATLLCGIGIEGATGSLSGNKLVRCRPMVCRRSPAKDGLRWVRALAFIMSPFDKLPKI